jgi:hypothetical protein
VYTPGEYPFLSQMRRDVYIWGCQPEWAATRSGRLRVGASAPAIGKFRLGGLGVRTEDSTEQARAGPTQAGRPPRARLQARAPSWASAPTVTVTQAGPGPGHSVAAALVASIRVSKLIEARSTGRRAQILRKPALHSSSLASKLGSDASVGRPTPTVTSV